MNTHKNGGLLCFDLDHTLIYSHRHSAPGRRFLVECYRDKPLSFMTERTYRFFQMHKDAPVCFISARTPEQFQRIVPFQEEMPFPAVLCGGSVLWRNGKADADFQAESAALAADATDEIARIAAMLGSFCEPEHIHCYSPLFVYAVSDHASRLTGLLRRRSDPARVRIYADGRKIYCLPVKTDKGAALTRLRALYHAESVFAAGDSDFDVPMLNAADFCAIPAELHREVFCANIRYCGTGCISDKVCTAAEEFLELCGTDF